MNTDGDAVRLVRIAASSARVAVVAEPRDDVTVDGNGVVERVGSTMTITAEAGNITVRVPLNTDVVIGNSSGRIAVSGPVGAVNVVTESGRVEIETAQSVDVRTSSGKVDIGVVADGCCVRTQSGRVEVSGCADADIATESARIDLNGVRGQVRAHCVSGRIEIEMLEAHDVEAETVSGRVDVSMPGGVVIGTDCTVFARSVSGRVDVSTR